MKSQVFVLCGAIFLVWLQENKHTLYCAPTQPKWIITLSLSRVLNLKFLLLSKQKYCITRYEELGF